MPDFHFARFFSWRKGRQGLVLAAISGMRWYLILFRTDLGELEVWHGGMFIFFSTKSRVRIHTVTQCLFCFQAIQISTGIRGRRFSSSSLERFAWKFGKSHVSILFPERTILFLMITYTYSFGIHSSAIPVYKISFYLAGVPGRWELSYLPGTPAR